MARKFVQGRHADSYLDPDDQLFLVHVKGPRISQNNFDAIPLMSPSGKLVRMQPCTTPVHAALLLTSIPNSLQNFGVHSAGSIKHLTEQV